MTDARDAPHKVEKLDPLFWCPDCGLIAPTLDKMNDWPCTGPVERGREMTALAKSLAFQDNAEARKKQNKADGR